MSEKLTEALERDGMTVYFTHWTPDLPPGESKADVIVVDALEIEHATSIACNLLTERGLDGEITRRLHWTKPETGEEVFQIDFDLS